jgi:hypothetical protein
MDEIVAPYLLGETVKIDGISHDPRQYLGLLILMPRGTLKSSMMGLLMLWIHICRKLRLNEDARSMYVHQVQKKAIRRGEVVRDITRHNQSFRQRFPEFIAPKGEWDTKEEWRWPNYTTHGAAEFSFTGYGESSSKIGGHYTESFIDDFETDESVTTPDMIQATWETYELMDNLKDLTRKFNPWVVCGTTYHHQGVHCRIERDGGYLVFKRAAHLGTAKALFDLCANDHRDPKGRLKIEAGLRRLEKNRSDDLQYPHLYPWRVLYQKARAGRSSYGGQQMLDPAPEGDARFNREAIERCWTDTLPTPAEAWGYLRCDPAISKKKKNDDTGMHLALVDWRGWRWFVDGFCGKEPRPTEQVRKMYALVRQWQSYGYKIINIGVEAVQYQEALAQLCRLGVPEREPTFHGEKIQMLMAPCPIRSIYRKRDATKAERLSELDGPLTRGEVRVFEKNPVGHRTMDQLKHHPHDKDDLLDPMRDMWDGVLLPPKPMEAEEPHLPTWIKRYMKEFDSDHPTVEGMNNSVTLVNWG